MEINEVTTVGCWKCWKPITSILGMIETLTFKDVIFPFRCFFIDSVPAYYFAPSLEDIVYRGPVNFSGVLKIDELGNRVSFRTTIVWVGKRPSKEVLESMHIENYSDFIKQTLEISGTKIICNSKGVLKFISDKILITSKWNPCFVAYYPTRFAFTADLRDGDQVVFDAVGTQFASVRYQHSPPRIFMNYRWIATAITKLATKQEVNNAGGSESNLTSISVKSKRLTSRKQKGRPRLRKKKNGKVAATFQSFHQANDDDDDDDDDSEDDEDDSHSIARLEKLRQREVNNFGVEDKVQEPAKAFTFNTGIKNKVKDKGSQTSTKMMVDKSVQTTSTGDISYHKVYMD
ncbi:Uncharacterised protein g1047 [Pycnogonum litorale]